MSRRVRQLVDVIEERPVGGLDASRTHDDYDVLASVPDPTPPRDGPTWSTVAEMDLTGNPVRQW